MRAARPIAGVRTVTAAAVRSGLTTHTATGVHACLLAQVLTIARWWVWTVASLAAISSRPHGDYMTVAVPWFLSAGRRWPTTKSGGGVLKATTRPMSVMEPWHAFRFLPFGFWSGKRRPCSLRRKRQQGRETAPTSASSSSVRPSIHSIDLTRAQVRRSERK